MMTPMMRRNAAWLPSVFNDLFDTEFMPKANQTAPAINVKETDKAYIVELAAPGMKKEDFNVHINDEGNLIIKMEQKEEKKDEDKNARYLRREFSYTDIARRRGERTDQGPRGARSADRGAAQARRAESEGKQTD